MPQCLQVQVIQKDKLRNFPIILWSLEEVPADNSGVFSYVSICHNGTEVAPTLRFGLTTGVLDQALKLIILKS